MTAEIDTASVDGIIVMTNTFDAPRDVVWTAFTEPQHVVKWYGGRGFSNPVCEMDVRPGGLWRHVMRTPDGAEHALEFVFVEVKKPEKLSWQNAGHASRTSGPPTCLNTLTLEAHGQKTKSKFVARFSSAAERDIALGWGFAPTLIEGVDRMAEVLESLLKRRSA
jgi:uncharacterized protein YndB with AHSA1/START domain